MPRPYTLTISGDIWRKNNDIFLHCNPSFPKKSFLQLIFSYDTIILVVVDMYLSDMIYQLQRGRSLRRSAFLFFLTKIIKNRQIICMKSMSFLETFHDNINLFTYTNNIAFHKYTIYLHYHFCFTNNTYFHVIIIHLSLRKREWKSC